MWLFVVPHDDDIVIGGGMLLQMAHEQGVRFRCVITTDGRQGYCSLDDRPTIVERRRQECRDSFALLGVDNVTRLEFPDNDLPIYCGRRRAIAGSIDPIEGYTGLQNSYVYHLRHVRPTRVFTMSSNDYHPDHMITYQQLVISLLHAAGSLWPELGEPLEWIPHLYEMPSYCKLTGNPDLRLSGSPDHFQRKLDAIAMYRSQLQIKAIVDNIRDSERAEYFAYRPIIRYRPEQYAALFA